MCNSDISVRGVSSLMGSSATQCAKVLSENVKTVIIDLLAISLFRENNFTSGKWQPNLF